MPKVPAKLYAHAGGVVGPDGTHVGPGQPIPASWPAEVRQSLYDSGGATAKPVDVGPQAATGEPQLVEAEAHLVRTHRGPLDSIERTSALAAGILPIGGDGPDGSR